MNYEKRDLEDDCADSDFDSDCTGNDARSDVVYVEVKKRGNPYGCSSSYFSILTK